MNKNDFTALLNSLGALYETEHLALEHERKPKPHHMARLTDTVYSALQKLGRPGESVDAILRRLLNLPKRMDRRTVLARRAAKRSQREES